MERMIESRDIKHMACVERIKQLEEENETLKDNVEFLHSCLDDRDKSIAIMQEENKKLKEEKDFFYKSAKQFREDGESWRKEAELLLGIKIMGKTLAERIDDDKKVFENEY